MIPFNKPTITGREIDYIKESITAQQLAGSGKFNKQCATWIEQQTKGVKALLTNSSADALEIAVLLTDIKPGDEIIMPSFTDPYTANPFVLRGATIVFVDVRADTMNIDEQKIDAAITPKTKAIVVTHFAGISADMDRIMVTANLRNVIVIEHASQALLSSYHEKKLGTIGHFGTYSFHETKNLQCGEGGALMINSEAHVERARLLQENGIDHTAMQKAEEVQHAWKDVGSSFLLSELNAAFLWAQLEDSEKITAKRQRLWQRYYSSLNLLVWQEKLQTPTLPKGSKHNGHLFYIKLNNKEQREGLLDTLIKNGIHAKRPFAPLHSTDAGKRYGRFFGEEINTTTESDKMLRLPMYTTLSEEEVDKICDMISSYLK